MTIYFYIAWLLLLCVFDITIAQYPSPNWRNVAVNKPCNMSSKYLNEFPDNDCSKANNGNNGTTYENGNCIHTALGDLMPSWVVDLGDSYVVRGITVYARARETRRMTNVSVSVDNNEVFRFPLNESDVQIPTNIGAESGLPKLGRHVKLSKVSSLDPIFLMFLNFCEVQVWVCSPGYYGQNCAPCDSVCANLTCDDINNPNSCPNPCESSPCQNNGTCQRGAGANVGTYTCLCGGTGYEGRNCQQDINECSTSNPCRNGGTCTNTEGSYTCTCDVGFTGKQCDDDVDECLNNPCLNGGTCINTVGSYSCNCSLGYNGTFCEVTTEQTGGSTGSISIAAAAGGAVAAVVVVVVVVVLVVVIRDPRTRRPDDWTGQKPHVTATAEPTVTMRMSEAQSATACRTSSGVLQQRKP